MNVDKKIREFNACLGMIAEITVKCNLIKERISSDWSPEQEEYQKEANKSIQQMQSDLSKYSQRIKQIHRELKEYDSIYQLG